jgi:DNA polymerase-3 subunit epsilon
MPLKLLRKLASFDLETTGTDTEKDRIVSISIVFIDVDYSRSEWSTFLNPGVPIPPNATAIHGITDEMVADKPWFAHAAPLINELLQDCDLTGYNMLMFDLPMLEAEFRRCGLHFSREGRFLADPQRIFFKMQPRTLAAALKFYCGRELEGAHSALPDAVAAVDVLMAQVDHYPEFPDTVEGLDRFCIPADWVDSDGKLKRNPEGKVYLGFGVHHDKLLTDVALTDPSYLTWIIGANFQPVVKEHCRLALDSVGFIIR